PNRSPGRHTGTTCAGSSCCPHSCRSICTLCTWLGLTRKVCTVTRQPASDREGAHCVLALEQLTPSEAIELAARTTRSGFAGVVLDDRFQPWLPSQGQAPFVWMIAGAIRQQPDGMLAVSAVPGYRSHPATVAQASATLAALHPGGHRLLLSAGDAIDEHIVG